MTYKDIPAFTVNGGSISILEFYSGASGMADANFKPNEGWGLKIQQFTNGEITSYSFSEDNVTSGDELSDEDWMQKLTGQRTNGYTSNGFASMNYSAPDGHNGRLWMHNLTTTRTPYKDTTITPATSKLPQIPINP